MADETVFVKYVGTVSPWFESAVTGRQAQWTPGKSDYVSQAIAEQLAATGLFEVGELQPVMARTTLTGGIEILGPSGDAVIVIEAAAPDDEDGRADGVIYIQTEA